MAVQDLTASASAIGTVYAKLALRDVYEDAFWSQFAGEPGSGNAIIRRSEIMGGPGSSITVPVTSPISGVGRTEVQTLSGNEVVIPVTNVVLTPVFTRQGILIERLAQMRSSIDLHEEARVRLAEWGKELVDSKRFVAYSSGSGTPNSYYQGAGHTAINQVTSTDFITVDSVRQMKKTLVVNGATPLKTRNGANLFGLVIHPELEYKLKSDSAWNTAVVQAGERGMDNGWNNGLLGVVDGMAIFVDRGTQSATDGAASTKIHRALAFGAEAFVEGWAENAFWADDHFDYNGQTGHSFGFSVDVQRSPVKKNFLIGYFAGA